MSNAFFFISIPMFSVTSIQPKQPSGYGIEIILFPKIYLIFKKMLLGGIQDQCLLVLSLGWLQVFKLMLAPTCIW